MPLNVTYPAVLYSMPWWQLVNTGSFYYFTLWNSFNFTIFYIITKFSLYSFNISLHFKHFVKFFKRDLNTLQYLGKSSWSAIKECWMGDGVFIVHNIFLKFMQNIFLKTVKCFSFPKCFKIHFKISLSLDPILIAWLENLIHLKIGSNTNEVIRVISSLFYEKILQAKKKHKNAYDILKCV